MYKELLCKSNTGCGMHWFTSHNYITKSKFNLSCETKECQYKTKVVALPADIPNSA